MHERELAETSLQASSNYRALPQRTRTMDSDNIAAVYPDLVTHLKSLAPAETRLSLIESGLPRLVGSVHAISQVLHASHRVSLVGTANAFGDDQLNVDVLAKRIIRSDGTKCPTIVTASS